MSTISMQPRRDGALANVIQTIRRGMEGLPFERNLLYGAIILAALIFFELFNYSTTEFALSSLLGGLNFAGLRWATILALAFCGIDFAGIARLFSPATGGRTDLKSWYLIAAWLLAATMNALLTWWAVTLALLQDVGLGNEIISRADLLTIVPLFVALLVWLIRILMIGSFTLSSARANRASTQQTGSGYPQPVRRRERSNGSTPRPVAASRPMKPAPKPGSAASGTASGRAHWERG